jgi:hypothetical protein
MAFEEIEENKTTPLNHILEGRTRWPVGSPPWDSLTRRQSKSRALQRSSNLAQGDFNHNKSHCFSRLLIPQSIEAGLFCFTWRSQRLHYFNSRALGWPVGSKPVNFGVRSGQLCSVVFALRWRIISICL